MINKIKFKFLGGTEITPKTDSTGNIIAPYIDEFFTGNKISKRYPNTSTQYMPIIKIKRNNFKASYEDRYVVDVEFCPAKLLYGNNLYEVCKADFEAVLTALHNSLDVAGFEIPKDRIRWHSLSRIDYSKVFISKYNEADVGELFLKVQSSGIMKRATTLFEDEAKMISFYYNGRRLSLYYKNKELLKDRKVSKEFKDYIRDTGLNFFRWEYNLKDATAISREFRRHGLMLNQTGKCSPLGYKQNTFEDLFDENIGRIILQNYLNEILERAGNIEMEALLSEVENLSKQGKIKGPQNIMAFIGFLLSKKELGLNKVKAVLSKVADKDEVYKLFSKFRNIDIPKELISQEVKREIEDALCYMKPMSKECIEDFLELLHLDSAEFKEQLKEYEESLDESYIEMLRQEFMQEQYKCGKSGIFPCSVSSNTENPSNMTNWLEF